MNVSKKLTMFLLCMISVLEPISAKKQLVLQASHQGPITYMEWHDRSESIVSVGQDGRLIVTDPDMGQILHRFKISSETVCAMQVDSSGDRVAVVSTHSEKYTIAVWDWGDEKQLFDYPLKSEPLFISWSSKGSYLIVGNLGKPSVLVLDGRNGKPLSYLQHLPSLYDAGYIGSTEKILMTYAPSGAIRYWDIRSSVLKLSTETLTNLQHIVILQFGDKSTLFARRDDILYLINRQNGSILDTMAIPGLEDVSVNPKNGIVDVLVTSAMGTLIRQFSISNKEFVEEILEDGPAIVNTKIKPVAILRGKEHSFVATDDGTLLKTTQMGFSPVVPDFTWRPNAIVFDDESAYISGNDQIIRFSSAFFAEDATGNLAKFDDLSQASITLDNFNGLIGLEKLSNGRLLAWEKEGSSINNAIRVFDFEFPENRRSLGGGPALSKVKILDAYRILTVDRSGTVNILDSQSGEILTEYSTLGILDASYIAEENHYILAGRSTNNSGTRTSLESIDVKTRESMPIADRRFMIYHIENALQSIYTIGIEQKTNGEKRTVLMSHNKKNPSRSTTIAQSVGEDMHAIILPISSGEGVYTTLGGKLERIIGKRRLKYDWEGSVSFLAERGKILYGINEDGKLLLWNRATGKLLMQVYLFRDGSWAAFSRKNIFLAASNKTVMQKMFLQ